MKRLVPFGALALALLALPVVVVAVAVDPGGAGAAATTTGGISRLAWAEAFSSAVGAPSPEAVKFVLAWETEEGATSDANNPLNSSLPEPGSGLLAGNLDGVRVYPTLAVGLQAALATLTSSNPAFGYLAIVDALMRADMPSAADALQRSSWCVDPQGPSGHECPGYGDAVLRIAQSFADPAAFAAAGAVPAGTVALPAGERNATETVAGVGTGPGPPARTPPADAVIPTLLGWLRGQIGRPYVWGGTGPAGYDCSGLAMMGYAVIGVPLPRTAAEQYFATVRFAHPRAAAEPGDLLFWASRPADPATIHHVAVYVGGGRMIEAAHEGVPVHEVAVWDDGGLLPVVTRPVQALSAGAS